MPPRALHSPKATPSILQFGVVDIGQTETHIVTVTNGGSTSVTLSKVSMTEAAFAAPNLALPLVVPAGQSVDVSVSFTPKTTGWTGGMIKFSGGSSTPYAVDTDQCQRRR